MKCLLLRPGKRGLTALGVLLLAPAAWALFLAVVPTSCARQKIADRLSQATGRKVTLGRVRVGAFGGVSIGDLRIGAPGPADDPWLHVVEASIDVNLWQMLFGRIDPTVVDVKGLRLRVLRRRDGGLELADLLRPGRAPSPTPSDTEAGSAGSCEPTGLEVRVRDATVLVVDEPTGTRVEFTGVVGRGTCQGALASITELRGGFHGGTIQLAAQLDRSETTPRFEGQIRLRGVTLGEGMHGLGYLVPVLAGTRSGPTGKLTLDLYLRGRGDTHAAIRESLVGQGRLALDPVSLDGSRILTGLADLFDLPARSRVGDVWADLTIKNGRVATENLTIDVARVPVVLAGWTDFDGRIDYRLHADDLIEKLPGQAQDYLNQMRPELKLDELSDVRIQGTVDALCVTSHGVPVTRGDDRRRVREIGRRVRDQIGR